MASPRSLTSIPYDAASQFNRYFESDKVDCKYNPNSAESPKPEFQQQLAPPHTPQQQQQPNSGKEGSTNLEVVKTEQPEINNVIHATLKDHQVSKYNQLLALLEEMNKDVRPSYAGSKSSSERLKRGIAHARILVREALLETSGRN